MMQRARRDRFGWLTDNGVLLVVLTTLFWGGNAVAGKLAVGNVSPLMLTFARWTISALLLLAIGWRYLRDDWPTIRQHFGFLFVAGAFGFAVFNGLLYTALKYTTALNVAILQPGMPVFIFALNFLIFRLHVQTAQAIGYSITLIGILLVAGQGDLWRLAQFSINSGDLIMLVAVLVYAAYSVALRAKPDLHWMSFLTVLVISAAVVSGAHGYRRILARPADHTDEYHRLGRGCLHRDLPLDRQSRVLDSRQ